MLTRGQRSGLERINRSSFASSFYQNQTSPIEIPSEAASSVLDLLSQNTFAMRRSTAMLCCLLITQCSFLLLSAQLTTPPGGGNKKAWVGERIGITDITIHYDRPGVKGREGKIWGQLVPVGFTDPGFGSSKSSPWRAGAN